MTDTNTALAADRPSYSIDADPQGIRALVADAISDAMAFGAQGVHPPPEGHWLTPFWNAAHADAQPAATVYTMEALVPGGGVKHHAQLHAPLPAGTKLYAAPQPNAALADGWKLVPPQITDEMANAWQSAFGKQLQKRLNGRGRLKSAAPFKKSCEEVAYVAMLAAAPPPLNASKEHQP